MSEFEINNSKFSDEFDKLYKSDIAVQDHLYNIDKTLKEAQKNGGVNRNPLSEKRNKPVDNETLLFSDYNHRKYWGGFTGHFHDGDFKLTLRNEFDKENKNYFLAYMIQRCISDNIEISPFEQTVSEEDIFDFLMVYRFKNYFTAAYQSSGGYYKCYRTFCENGDRICGTIDIARHIKLNMGMNNGKIAHIRNENTVDNHVNYLIIHTFELLKKRHSQYMNALLRKDTVFYQRMNDLKIQCPGWSDISVRETAAKTRSQINKPFYLDYEKLRECCFKILRREGLSFNSEDSESDSNTFLFYLPDLWEMYLEVLLKELCSKYTFSPDSQKKLIVFPNSNVEFPKYPDFFIEKKDGKRIVLDAKFKSWLYDYLTQVGEKAHYSSFVNDIQQCFIYKCLLNADETAILFPYSNTGGKCYFESLKISNENEQQFLFFGLNIPEIEENDSYKKWKVKMRENEIAFVEQLETSLNNMS